MRPLRIFPSGKGLHKPSGSWNPSEGIGFSRLENWKVQGNTLRLGPGTEYAFPNWVLHPLKLDDSTWSKVYVTVYGSRVTGVDGTTTAQILFETADTDYHHISQQWAYSAIADNVQTVVSIYVAEAGRTKFRLDFKNKAGNWNAINVDISAKTYSTVTGSPTVEVQDVGDGVVRVVMVFNMESGTDNPIMIVYLRDAAGNLSYAGDTAKGICLWGPQVQFAHSSGVNIKVLPFTIGANVYGVSGPSWLYAVQMAAPLGPHPKSDTKYYYITGTALRRIVESGDTESILEANFLAATSSTYLSSCYFRDHILVAHISEGLKWIKPSDDSYRAVGVPAPTSKPTAAEGSAGDLTGTYKYTVTYVNDKGHEGNPKMSGTVPDSASITVSSKKISLSSVPTGPTGVAKRRIYRTIANGDTFLYLTEIPDNTTTTLTDDNTADTALGSTLILDNDTPPSTIRQIYATAERVYLADADGTTLWASKIDEYTSEPNWEAYPYDLSIRLPLSATKDTLQGVFELGGFLHCAGRKGIFRISGDVGTGVVVDRVLDEGFFGRFTWKVIAGQLVFLNDDKKLRIWDGSGVPVDIGGDVQDILDDIYETFELQEPFLEYNASDEELYLSYAVAPGTSLNRALVFDLKNGNAHETALVMALPTYIPSRGELIGTGSTEVAGTNSIICGTGPRILGTKYATQIAETIAVHPLPGSDVMLGRLAIQVKAVPIVSYVPPTLKVEYALNESTEWNTKYVDLTRDFLVSEEGNSPVVKTVYVPVQRRANSITVRMSTVDNVASLDNGVEIYGISVEVQSEAYEEESKKQRLIDKKL